MSYYSLGATRRTETVVARRGGTTAPAATCKPPLVAGGYIQTKTSTGTMYWRRGRADECGNPAPKGLTKRVHSGGVVTTFKSQNGKLVKTGEKLEPKMQECVDTGMPAELVPLCYEGRKQGVPIDQVVAQLQAMAEGASPEAAAAQAAAVAPSTGGMKKILLIGGIAAGAVVLLLVLRKKGK